MLALSGQVVIITGAESTLLKFRRIDALVNNAGYGTRGPVELVPVDAIRWNYEVNLFSLIALTQLVVPHLRERGGGCIVNIGSVAGRIARPLSSIYDSTKHALEAITDGLRGELKPFGVRVTLIRPGYIITEFIEAANRASDAYTENAGPYEPYLAGFRLGYQRLRSVARIQSLPSQVLRASCVREVLPGICALGASQPSCPANGSGHSHWTLKIEDWGIGTPSGSLFLSASVQFQIFNSQFSNHPEQL